MLKIAWTTLAAISLVACAAAYAAPQPYVVPNSQVIELSSKQTGADYQLFVSLPLDYTRTRKSYPVVYMLDADYSFALVRNVVQHFVERDDLPPMILVAIAYPGAATNRETYKKNRTRDYTPVYAPDRGYGAEYQAVSGGGPKFRAFIATELVPLIERRFRANPSDRTIIGHSYGGLFATYVLLTEPALFKRYVVVSPSLWYANRVAFSMEETAAQSGIRPDAQVFFGVGALENTIMAEDLTDMFRRLRSRNNPRLKMTLRIFEEERHNSVFPAAVTRGLLTVFDSPAARGTTPPPFADGR